MNCEPEPLGPENPHAIGFCAKETELTHELAAIRNVNTESSRIWKIKNESVRNRLTGGAVDAWLAYPVRAGECDWHVQQLLACVCCTDFASAMNVETTCVSVHHALCLAYT